MQRSLRLCRPSKVAGRQAGAPAHQPLPSPMRGTFINRSPKITTSVSGSSQAAAYRHTLSITDVAMRPLSFCGTAYRPNTLFNGCGPAAGSSSSDEMSKLRLSLDAPASIGSAVDPKQQCEDAPVQQQDSGSVSFGEQLEEMSVRWGMKFFGNSRHGPRNSGYNGSRWYKRRYRMKKHRYTKRWRFRRYKVAAIANMPIGKLIRVNLLPQLRGNSKSGDSNADMAANVMDAQTAAIKGKKGGSGGPSRGRPRSKYQV